jgi:hypothetical protein
MQCSCGLSARTSHILPKRFSDLAVERGGFGAVTIIRFHLRVGGRRQFIPRSHH